MIKLLQLNVSNVIMRDPTTKHREEANFPEVPITRKMHLMGFVISPLIATDKTQNICYKYLKLEQMGERLHAIWNLLHRTRFFSVRNGNDRLMNMFMEYENSLYVKK